MTIPDGVTSIGEGAFSGCSGLASITFGSSVSSIGKDAFNNTNLKKIIWLPNTPPSGADYAKGTMNYVSNDQYSFKNVNKVVYPYLSSYFDVDGIRYVPVNPSERTCDAIACVYDESAAQTKISSTVKFKTIEMTVQKIQPYVAYDNDFIESLTIDYDGEIPNRAFYGCTNLKDLSLGDKVTAIGSSAFADCKSIENLVIPNAVTSIGETAFSGCTGLTSVKIGNGTTSIGQSAFSGCTGLVSVKMGSGGSTIDQYAFSGCSVLNELTIGTQVKDIKDNAFENCMALQEVTIPKSVTSIGNYVFSGCEGLIKFIIADREEVLQLGSNGSSPLFSACPLDTVYIGGNISYPTSKNYGYSPFYSNKSLRAVHINGKNIEISDNEFYGCTGLKNVHMEKGVKSIGSWAFSGCSGLDLVEFGSGMESIGQEAFSDCTNITRIYSLASTPPTCGSQALEDINKWECNLFVPKGSIGKLSGGRAVEGFLLYF